MICRELDQFLHPYLDGEFDSSEAAEFELHLTDCSSCSVRLAEENALRQKVKIAIVKSEPKAPQSLRASIGSGLLRERRRETFQFLVRSSAGAFTVAALVGGI